MDLGKTIRIMILFLYLYFWKKSDRDPWSFCPKTQLWQILLLLTLSISSTFWSFDYFTLDLEHFWILFQINGGVESQKFCIRECEWMNSAKPFNLSFLYLYLFVYCTKRNKSFFTITYFNFDDTKEKEDLPHCHCGPLEFLCE